MPSPAAPTVLFLCTGNYYRSRFAEILFNHLAGDAGLLHRADSAGLAENCRSRNEGPLSPHARQGLLERGVPLPEPARYPRDATSDDFEGAALVVALKEAEHRPFLAQRFADFLPVVRFWHIDDVQDAPPSAALPALEDEVHGLVRHLIGERITEPRAVVDGDELPDVRDGLTRLDRIILHELDRARKELGRESVPTTMLYGRVIERMDVAMPEFQRVLGRLLGRGQP